jgi:6-phosphofructokinase 1
VEKSKTKTFGILTAGGDCPGLNAAIRGVCRAAHDRYGMRIIGIASGYKGLIEGDWRELFPRDYYGIITRGGTILGAGREKPFKDEDSGHDLVDASADDKVEAIKRNYKRLALDCLVCIGGNGTNSTAYKLSREGLNVIGLPKTIDNDIMGTDRSFGFNSALGIATEAIDRLHATAQSHNRVMVIELMGHKTGWLALYAGVAGGAHAILVPEIPYDIHILGKHLASRSRNGLGFSIVVAAEGAMSADEARTSQKLGKKEWKRLRADAPSIAYRLVEDITRETGLETRATVLGYVQRGGVPSASDRVLATSLGTAAAELLAAGQYGRMVCLEGNKVSSVDLSVPAGKTRTLPLDHYMVDTARSVGVCLGDR